MEEITQFNEPELLEIIQTKYDKIIKEFIKDPSGNDSVFLGGQPITLETNNIDNIISINNFYKQYNYSITPKLDGTRLLFFIFRQDGNINFIFIDRNNKFYTFNNKNLLTIKNNQFIRHCPEVILDGEMLCKNNQFSENFLDSLGNPNIKYIYTPFDILFGPTDLKIIYEPPDQRFTYEQSFALSGNQQGYKYNYTERYQILKKILTKIESNRLIKGPPPSIAHDLILKDVFQETSSFFIIEIKKIYTLFDIKCIFDNRKDKKNDLYNLIKDDYIEFMSNSISIKLNKAQDFDGLIFTPLFTEYVLKKAWKLFNNFQYKWKPLINQTIDLRLIKLGGKFIAQYKKFNQNGEPAFDNLNNLQYKSLETNKLIPIQVDFDIADSALSKLNSSINQTCEFRVVNRSVNTQIFKIFLVFINVRKDKFNDANAKNTVINVLKAVQKPVNLDFIYQQLDNTNLSFFNSKKILDDQKSKDKEDIVKIKKYLENFNFSKSNLISFLLKCNQINLFSKIQETSIKEQIKLFLENEEFELEIRLGSIFNFKFNPYINSQVWNYYKKLFSRITNYKENFLFFIDKFFILPDKTTFRKRVPLQIMSASGTSKAEKYKQAPEFLIETIKKIRIKNEDIDLNFLTSKNETLFSGFISNLRFSLSSEIIQQTTFDDKKANYEIFKQRTTFKIDIFIVDFTYSYILQKENQKKINEDFQIELEYNRDELLAQRIIEPDKILERTILFLLEFFIN